MKTNEQSGEDFGALVRCADKCIRSFIHSFVLQEMTCRATCTAQTPQRIIDVAAALDAAFGGRIKGAQLSWCAYDLKTWRPWLPYDCLDVLVGRIYCRIHAPVVIDPGAPYKTFDLLATSHDAIGAAVLSQPVDPNTHSWLATMDWVSHKDVDAVVERIRWLARADPMPALTWQKRPIVMCNIL